MTTQQHRVLAMDGRTWSVVSLEDGNVLLDLASVGLVCSPADFAILTRMISAGTSIYTTGDIIACAGPRRVCWACSHNVVVLLFDQTMLRLFTTELPPLCHMCQQALDTLGPVDAEPKILPDTLLN